MYCDLHCDALTSKSPVVTGESLRAGGCYLQCFAAFVRGEGCYGQAASLAEKFYSVCKEEGLHPVKSALELKEGGINALFTVEGGEAAEGSIEKLNALYALGVRMLTLTWNYPNALGFPNFPNYEGLFTGAASFEARERERGLTPFGRKAVSEMLRLGMIVDVSHGSDKLFFDVAALMRRAGKPFVASHSGANAAFCHARNLTDGQLRALAECGGAVGLNFCADFLGRDSSSEGQRAALLAHARAIVNAGGEDTLALGSDFDGIPQNPYLKDPSYLPKFLEALTKEFGSRAAEKFARGNFLRVFREICK